MREIIKNAISQLMGNKLRTFLTMLGMLIGISAVIIILGLGQGMKDYMNAQFSTVGKGAITVIVYSNDSESLLDNDDIEMIESIPEVKEAMLLHNAYTGITQNSKKEDKRVLVYGLPYNYEDYQSLKLRYGRMFAPRDEEVKANVAIVEDNYARIMCKKSDPEYILGKDIEITIGGEVQSFEVIGIAKSQYPSSAPDKMVMPIVYLPFTTMDQYVMDGQCKGDAAAIIIDDAYDATDFTKPIQKLLEKQHAVKDIYEVSSTVEQTEAFSDILDTLSIFISVVAAISLLVGGIGIMNIMLVTVRERTREIGIRKALGATDKQILNQFLIEALILTLLGGISGLIIGYIGSVIIGGMITITAKLTVGMVVFSVGTSSAIGIVFGVYPAYRASKLDPVEALREE